MKGDDFTEKIPSFVLYVEYSTYFKMLSVKDKAMLIDAIFDYAAEGVLPDKLSDKAMVVFTVIKNQFDRDAAKYIERRKIARRNGALGGRPRKTEKTEKTCGFSEEPVETFNTDTDIDTDSDSDITTTTSTSTYTDTVREGGGGGSVTESDFMSFWEIYPKHIARGEAREAFFGAVHTREDYSELIDLVERWKNSEAWKTEDGRFINKPARFLTDFFPTRDEPPPNSSSFDTDEFFQAALRRSYAEYPLDDHTDQP